MKSKNVYSDDYAMTYEYLIRRAFQCGRYGVAGADADIYRRFLRRASMYKSEKDAIENNKPRQWGQSIEEMLKDHMVSAGQVSAYINTAIDKVKRSHSETITSEQVSKLEEAEMKLLDVCIENIVDAIDISGGVMKEMGLFPQ